jgi:hypothetical protein
VKLIFKLWTISSILGVGLAFGASTFYISPSGDDANPGTKAKPWKTLQHAADTAKPGTTINLLAGTYCQSVDIKVSGDAKGGFITFRSEPGQKAVVDGSCLTVPQGGTRGGAALVALHSVSYVRIEGLEICNYKTEERDRTPAGIHVSGAGSHIELLHNNVHNIEQNFQGRERVGSGGNGFGIAVYGTDPQTPITDLVIDGNEVHHLKTGSSESLTVNGNIDGFRVTHNVVHDNNNIGIDLIGGEHACPTPAMDKARNGVISQNQVYSITSRGNPAYGNSASSDGIYVDGGTHLMIERNTIHDVDFGMELASEHANWNTSYITARNNLIYACHNAGIAIGGYDARRGSTENCVIVNNTLYQNNTWSSSGEFMMQFYLKNNIFANNIIFMGPKGVAMRSRTARTGPDVPTVTMDHNIYYFAGGSKEAKWRFDNQDYASFEEYVQATGNDKNSKFADPIFVDAAAANFHLQKNSPARGVGENTADKVGTEDLDGARRIAGGKIDIGCYQSK